MRRRVKIALVLLASSAAAPAIAAKTLYDQLGGMSVIQRVSNEFVDIATSDGRVASSFGNSNLDRIRHELADQICAVSNGPCQYKGHSMTAAHKGLHITEAGFNAIVEDLQSAMDRSGVGYRTQNALLARLAPMRRVIVTR